MSLLDDLANAFGHTIDSLAQDLGVATSDLEQIVNELAGFGIDVFSVASKIHLDPLTLLRNLVSLMKGDPHQAMISSMTAPFKPYEEPLYQLSQQWAQMAVLHQTTAQAIQQHMDELLSSSGSSSYSGPAATTLLNTHTSYQHYFTNAVVPHASTQGTRHQGLAQGFSDDLAQTPSDVYKLPKPVAALGVLGFRALASAGAPAPPDAPPAWLSDIINWGENTETDLENDAGNVPPGPEDPDGQQTGNIVGALLSGDSGKAMEGQVALCLLNQVTAFRQLIGPGGSTTEIDVGTASAEISVKQPGVGSSGVLSQLQQLRSLYPGTKVILFAPGYANKNPASARGIKGDGYPIVGDCASLQAAL